MRLTETETGARAATRVVRMQGRENAGEAARRRLRHSSWSDGGGEVEWWGANGLNSVARAARLRTLVAAVVIIRSVFTPVGCRVPRRLVGVSSTGGKPDDGVSSPDDESVSRDSRVAEIAIAPITRDRARDDYAGYFGINRSRAGTTTRAGHVTAV